MVIVLRFRSFTIFPRTQCDYPLVCWLNLFPMCVSVLKKFIRAGCRKYDVK